MKAVLVSALILVGAAGPSVAQVVPPDVPAWADSAFRHSPQFAGYDYPDLSPGVAIGDFAGDGCDDVAVEIKSRDGLQRGLALIHFTDGSVHILGAGQAVGNGHDEIREWSVIVLRHHRAAIGVTQGFDPGGMLWWDGHGYRWIPNQ